MKASIETGRARCPHCGRVIGSPRELVDGPVGFPPETIRCPECGKEMELTWVERVEVIYKTEPASG